MTTPTPFTSAQQQVDACAEILHLDPGVSAILRVPMREVHVSLPIRMDDGSTRIFCGFRVQYNDARGPTKGGVRFHPNLSADLVRAHAAWMTWKCALLDLPLGGASGGIACNPREMSQMESERLSRAYVRAIYEILGPDKDVPAPDVYTNPQTMAWMMDEYSRLRGKNQFGVITGKPRALGGSVGRGDATARGGLYCVREAANELGVPLEGASVAVQGYGNVGFYAATLGQSLFGTKIVAISDSRGGIYNSDGVDPLAVQEHKARTGSVVNFPDSDPISNDELLELDVDVLIPASLENVITEANAAGVKARIVAELANGPTTPEADTILTRHGVHVVPDFLCNAGGVTVSYFEMVQNAYMFYWDEAMVHERLDKMMSGAYQAVLETAREYKIDMRQAAYVVAVRRVIEAMQLRGWV